MAVSAIMASAAEASVHAATAGAMAATSAIMASTADAATDVADVAMMKRLTASSSREVLRS